MLIEGNINWQNLVCFKRLEYVDLVVEDLECGWYMEMKMLPQNREYRELHQSCQNTDDCIKKKNTLLILFL